LHSYLFAVRRKIIELAYRSLIIILEAVLFFVRTK
jgi:hypothetical protein